MRSYRARTMCAAAGLPSVGRVTSPVLTRYPLDATAARRRRRRIAVVVAARRVQSGVARPRAAAAREGAAPHAR